MNNAKDRHTIGGVLVIIDDDVRRHDADTNIRPESRTQRANGWMIGESIL
jgi:hypothetical protein